MKKTKQILSAILMCISLMGCETTNSNDERNPCNGVFNMEMDGYVEKSLCAANLTSYHFSENALSFEVKNEELAGRVLFEIAVIPFKGPGIYEFGTGETNKCKLIVRGASDEFYQCTSGTIEILEASQTKLDANFKIAIEGFYNKKIIHARGGVRL